MALRADRRPGPRSDGRRPRPELAKLYRERAIARTRAAERDPNAILN
jgi:hypothetical protein